MSGEGVMRPSKNRLTGEEITDLEMEDLDVSEQEKSFQAKRRFIIY